MLRNFHRVLSLTAAFCLSAVSATAQADSNQSNSFNDELNYPRLGISTNHNLQIVRITDGSPAAKANLLIGDTIVSIEGQKVATMDERSRRRSLVGQSGTLAHLGIERAGKSYAVTIVRAAPLPAVSQNRTQRAPGISTADQASQPTSSAPLKPTGLDDRLITVQRRTKDTDEVMQQLLKGLSYLPDSVKLNFIDNGVKVVETPSRFELIGTHGRLSFQQQFLDLYNAEADKVPADKRKMLAYFLEDESSGENAGKMAPHHPPEECFASLFAAKYYKGQDKRLEALKQNFPRTSAYVESLRP